MKRQYRQPLVQQATTVDIPSNRWFRFITVVALFLSLAAVSIVGLAADRSEHEVAILAGGCFWGMEDLLRDLDGVIDTEVGYISDARAKGQDPAESVRIIFDPSRISYEEILRFYFRIHDPTSLNRQGNDVGTEYRSAVFVRDSDQRAVTERVRTEVNASTFWKKPLVTEILGAGTFTVAEDYHQDYLVKNPGGYTCHYIRGE
ncbi:MAG: peptide-methionine (S)-S-oxide reductase MsrA [bacterium]|nr:peptide-methionine (S)-S-oxide reductase MsrA [bacterium]